MAVSVVLGFLIPLQEKISNVTQLLGESLLKFGRPVYSVAVSESATPGPLLQLTVKVYAEGVRVTFQIIEGNESRLFYLDSMSGLLSLAKPLDFETQPEHVLVVRATLQEEYSEAKVLIEVLDDNDHPPQFLRDLHETQITEEDDRHLPKTIMTVSATDADAGRHGQLKYYLLEDYLYDEVLECFSVDGNTGDILLLKPLDRDPPYGQSKWHFDVVATDGQFKTSTSVIVNVKDVNDNAPYFVETSIKAFVMENRPQGTLVTTVGAIDHDDPDEGTNAKIVYSLEKNVIDELTGRPIFSVNDETGRVETALCCLDREQTDSYTIQVVATDGGGLKGTGTVLVNISDENDVPPKFSKSEWFLDVKEELGPDDIVASLGIIDPDVINEFQFKIVTESGNGWDLFYVTSQNGKPGANLHSKYGLDFENPQHRVGFRFQIKISDMGSSGWSDNYHIDSTWVNLRLSDINDNAPRFLKEAYHKNIFENVPPGTALVAVKAVDVDDAGGAPIQYVIDPKTDPYNLFLVDQTGVVRLRKPLDREVTTNHRLVIWAKDRGDPVKTATATIVVDVNDVNDNPPYLTSPTRVRIREGSSPRVVANLTLGDPDDWQKGHGPPFLLHLDPSAPIHIKRSIKVEFNKAVNRGAGFGIVRTVKPLDREKHRELLVPIIASDAGKPRKTATLTLTISIDDINDSKMAGGTKNVLVHLLRPGIPSSRSSVGDSSLRIPIGRIFVSDPDDWDANQKEYRWSKDNAFFSIDPVEGQIFMEPWTPPGRYSLEFLVFDSFHKQRNIPANVSVEVKAVTPNDLKLAIPTEFAADSKTFIRLIKGRSLLEAFARNINSFIQEGNINSLPKKRGVRIVSIQHLEEMKEVQSSSASSRMQKKEKEVKTRIWMTHPPEANLEHILLLKQKEIEKLFGAKMTSIGGGECNERDDCSSGCWMQTEIDKAYSLIDANSSSIVGPQLRMTSGCGCHPPTTSVENDPFSPRPVIKGPNINACNSDVCLNGGRCIPEGPGFRCICPYGTLGRRCKIHEREFEGGTYKASIEDEGGGKQGGSWAWLSALPSCSKVHISLEILTHHKEGIIFYAGDLATYEEDILNFFHYKGNFFADKLDEFSASDPSIKLYSSHHEKLISELRKKSTSGRSLKKFSISDERKRNIRNPRNSESLTKFRHKLRHSKSRHAVAQPKDYFKILKKNNSTSKDRLSLEGIYYPLKAFSAFNSPDNLLYGKGNFFRKLSKSYTQSNENPHHNNIHAKEPIGNIQSASLLKENHQKSERKRHDFILLALVDGYPRLMLNLGGGLLILPLQTDRPLSDLKIHRIDITWMDGKVELVVDLCSGGSFDDLLSPTSSFTIKAPPDAHHCRILAKLPPGGRMFNFKGPLQLGGYAPSSALSEGASISLPSFKGCLKNVHVNEKLMDLGHSILSSKSSPGCRLIACRHSVSKCGLNARCLGSPGSERCECHPGWTGESCSEKTSPVRLMNDSFITLALSFTPFSITTYMQLRFRTRQKDGELISLSSPHGRDSLSLTLRDGKLCQILRLHPEPPLYLCLTKITLTDGNWHSVSALRVGSGMLLTADDEDGTNSNSSLFFNGRPLMQLSRQDGLHIGGTPEYYSGKVTRVHRDFMEGCLDDVRLQGRPIPLPPEVNGTKWGQVTTFQQVSGGCVLSSKCANVTCRYPLSCTDTWGSYHCGCGEGKKPSYDGSACADVNECLWNPCLNNGKCLNLNPGYSCSCTSQYLGSHCHIGRENMVALSLSLSIGLTIAASFIIVLLLLFFGFLLFRRQKLNRLKTKSSSSSKPSSDTEEFKEKTYSETDEISFHLQSQESTSAKSPSSHTGFHSVSSNTRISDILKMKGPKEDGIPHSQNRRQRFPASELEIINTYKETKT